MQGGIILRNRVGSTIWTTSDVRVQEQGQDGHFTSCDVQHCGLNISKTGSKDGCACIAGDDYTAIPSRYTITA